MLSTSRSSKWTPFFRLPKAGIPSSSLSRQHKTTQHHTTQHTTTPRNTTPHHTTQQNNTTQHKPTSQTQRTEVYVFCTVHCDTIVLQKLQKCTFCKLIFLFITCTASSEPEGSLSGRRLHILQHTLQHILQHTLQHHICMYNTLYRTIIVYTTVFLKMDHRVRNL
jgi:hypothetical protein